MIKNWLVTGDTHGKIMTRLNNVPYEYEPSETALIILGDAGVNYYLNRTDIHLKQAIELTGFTVYCLHGNHEERPERLNCAIVHDDEVAGDVYCEPAFPHIRYLMDGGVYWFGKYRCLALGGAYSVDKWYRLERAGITSDAEHDVKARRAGWFDNEQMTKEKMDEVYERLAGQSFNIVMSHTCPLEWMPSELFLNGLAQESVDTTTEKWLSAMRRNVFWDSWVFGHFHDDMLVRPDALMLYTKVMPIEQVADVRRLRPIDTGLHRCQQYYWED